MSAAESVWWHGFAAGAGVWRRNGGEAERGVVWKQQKAPPGQTKSFKFLFSGAHQKDSEFFPEDFPGGFFSGGLRGLQIFF